MSTRKQARKAQENAAQYIPLADRSVQVGYRTPEQAQLPRWVLARQAKAQNLQLDDAARPTSAVLLL